MSGLIDIMSLWANGLATLVRGEIFKHNVNGTYTPTWSSTGTQPAIGDGTIAGQYVKIGSMCWATVRIQPGSTTTFGTGTYLFSLPFEATGYSGGGGYVVDTGTRIYDVTCLQYTTTAFYIVCDGGSELTPSSPFTLASGDIIQPTVFFMTL